MWSIRLHKGLDFLCLVLWVFVGLYGIEISWGGGGGGLCVGSFWFFFVGSGANRNYTRSCTGVGMFSGACSLFFEFWFSLLRFLVRLRYLSVPLFPFLGIFLKVLFLNSVY